MPTSRIPILICSLLLASSALAQSFSGFNPQQEVLTGPIGSSTSADGAYSVYAIDLDGDGDQDVLSASRHDNKVAWYENLTINLNGPASRGAFGPQQVITTSADAVQSVYAVDLDGDGDADVLSASRFDDKIAWYENLTVNLNGPSSPGTFGAQQVITTSADGPTGVYATDLDGDGDADVLSASDRDSKIAWYENLTVNQNGASSPGSFGPQQVLTGPVGLPTSADSARSVYAADLDGDGDADVLSASQDDDKIAWYENLTINLNSPASPVSFGPQQVITTSADGARSVYATDLDGDGDADVLSASKNDNKVAWYENLTVNLNGPASPGTFGSQQVITTSADAARSVYATDVDGDGDKDVLSASRIDDKVAWYENLTVNLNGASSPGTFGTQQVITTSADNARSVYAADLDGDGDADVLSASLGDDKIAWNENWMSLPVLVAAAEATPLSGTLGLDGGLFNDGDSLRWNFADPTGQNAGLFCTVVINLGPQSLPVGTTAAIPGFSQLWAGSSPTGFAAVAPPHVIGNVDYQLQVPPGVFLALDQVRIQGLVLDPANATGTMPVVASPNLILFTYLP